MMHHFYRNKATFLAAAAIYVLLLQFFYSTLPYETETVKSKYLNTGVHNLKFSDKFLPNSFAIFFFAFNKNIYVFLVYKDFVCLYCSIDGGDVQSACQTGNTQKYEKYLLKFLFCFSVEFPLFIPFWHFFSFFF